ncbi:hypothetical protein GCM10008932_05440 [Alkalibacterium iburiense]|uniref:Uncharacterized protein n=1 Tax=Alkalibacterium iburiense TaxID=290589 RepID=A0ABP3GXF4_9LACT
MLTRPKNISELEDNYKLGLLFTLFINKAIKRSQKILIPLTLKKLLNTNNKLYNIRNAVEKIACIDNCK